MKLYKYLFEADEEEIPEEDSVKVDVSRKIRLARDSVDDQIDSFLVKFESESALDEDEQLEESFYNHDLKYLLNEQPVLDPEAEAAKKPQGSEETEIETAEKAGRMVIDIDSFTSKVARLIINSDRLLDLQSAIVNRTIDFLENYYDADHVERFKSILEQQYDIDSKVFDRTYEANPAEYDSPQGLGAYDGGSGGGG